MAVCVAKSKLLLACLCPLVHTRKGAAAAKAYSLANVNAEAQENCAYSLRHSLFSPFVSRLVFLAK